MGRQACAQVAELVTVVPVTHQEIAPSLLDSVAAPFGLDPATSTIGLWPQEESHLIMP